MMKKEIKNELNRKLGRIFLKLMCIVPFTKVEIIFNFIVFLGASRDKNSGKGYATLSKWFPNYLI